jgi:predicted DNA-binding transcriptional regulator AlpA
MSTAAARQRLRRKRRSAGRFCVFMEVDSEARDALIEVGRLRQWDEDNHDAIKQAFEAFIRSWVQAVKVRARYGVCPSTLYRWDRDPDLRFPKPIKINGRKYRDEAELEAFDGARAAEHHGSRPRAAMAKTPEKPPLLRAGRNRPGIRRRVDRRRRARRLA